MTIRQLAILGLAAMATAPIGASAFQVNAFTTADQSPTSVAVDGAGNFVVVWESWGGAVEDRGEFAQLYNSLGVQAGTAFRVVPEGHPAASFAPDGSFVITGSGANLATPDTDGSVIAQRYDSLGVPVGTAVLVNTYTTGSQTSPVIAHGDDGRFTIAWLSTGQDGDSTGVFAQRFDAADAPIGGEFQVNTYTPNAQGSNGLAVAIAPDGDFIIAWHSKGQDDGDVSASGGGVYAQLFDSTGATVGAEFQVNTTTSGSQGFGGVDVATDAAGNFAIVWPDNREFPVFPGGNIAAQRYDSAGTPIGSEFTVNTKTGGPQFWPQIAMTAAGNFLVTFTTDDADRQGVSAQYFASDGTPVGNEFRVNLKALGEQNRGSIATNASGHFVAAWSSECRNYKSRCDEDEDGDGAGVFARRFDTAPPACSAGPQTGCFDAGKSRLLLSQSGGGKLLWKWDDGPAFDADNLGNPADGLTGHVLCMYQEDGGAPFLIMGASIPAGGTCGPRPCWKGRKTLKSYVYNDKVGSSDGIKKIRLKTGEIDRGKVVVKGRGASLAVPLPIGSFTRITTQLVNGNNECWQAEYDSARANSSSVFKASF